MGKSLPQYPAPEVFEGRKYQGPQIDIWVGLMIHTARNWNQGHGQGMGPGNNRLLLCCVLCTTQGQGTIVSYCAHPGTCPCTEPSPVQCVGVLKEPLPRRSRLSQTKALLEFWVFDQEQGSGLV